MKVKITLYIIPLTLSAFFSGCASYKWTENQKEQISEVGIGEIKIADLAYHSPDPTRSPGMSNAIPQATGGGLIPALIGIAIDASVVSNQKKSFEVNYAEYSLEIDEIYKDFPIKELEYSLEQYLKTDNFFSGRISENPKTKFKVEIKRIGFVRAIGATDDSLHFAFEITGNVKIENSAKELFLDKIIVGTSSSSQYPRELAKSPEKKDKFIQQAIDDFIKNLRSEINLRLDRPK